MTGVAVAHDLARVLGELGAVSLALAVLARFSHRFGLSPVPLYLLAGLAVGGQDVVALDLAEDFVATGAEIGVVLLLLALGLQFTAGELRAGLRTGARGGVVDAAVNFPPGFVAGLLLGWGVTASILLGGVTYISSSGIVSKLLGDLGRLSNRETPVVLSILVIEDLAMTVYLPIAATLAVGGALDATGAVTIAGAFGAVALALFLALRHGPRLTAAVAHQSDEVLLLSIVGVTFLVAGIAEGAGVSAAVGAFLVGVAIADPVSARAATLIGPLRDLFAALFFFLFGLQIDTGDLGPVLAPAAVLAVLTAAGKVTTGWWTARRAGIASRGRRRAGTALIARGEFSIVIAELGVAAGVERQLGPLAAAYVLLLAVAGPLAARASP